MGRGHGGAAGSRIQVIASVRGRARTSARRSNIRLCTVASISRDRAAATKGSYGISAGSECPDCVRRRIERRRIGHSGTTGAGVTRGDHHLDTSSLLSFNSGLQLISDNATLRDGATPRVNGNIRRLGGVTLATAYRIGRQEKFHALDVPGWCAVPLVHVTAGDPFCAGRHSDLISAAIVADGCAGCVRPVEVVITWLRRIVPAWIAYAIMNGIVPVVIVICVLSVPATVVRLERVMRPTNTGIGAGHNDILSGKSQRPNIRRMRVSNSRLDRGRRARLQGRLFNLARLRKVIMDVRIACDARNVGARSQRVSNLSSRFHQDGVNNIERLMLDIAVAQPLQDWLLHGLSLLQQGLIHEATLFGFSWQIRGRAQVGLVSEHDKKFSLLSVDGVLNHPWRDLVRDVDRVAANSVAASTNLNALPNSARRGESSDESHSSRNKEQRTKNTPPWLA